MIHFGYRCTITMFVVRYGITVSECVSLPFFFFTFSFKVTFFFFFRKNQEKLWKVPFAPVHELWYTHSSFQVVNIIILILYRTGYKGEFLGVGGTWNLNEDKNPDAEIVASGVLVGFFIYTSVVLISYCFGTTYHKRTLVVRSFSLQTLFTLRWKLTVLGSGILLNKQHSLGDWFSGNYNEFRWDVHVRCCRRHSAPLLARLSSRK